MGSEMCIRDSPYICYADALYQAPRNVADMPAEPFETFPKQLHVCGETHVAFIARGISHTYVKVLKIWLPVCGQYLLKGVNLKTGCCLITDGADYLVVGYGERRAYHDSAEHLVVYVALRCSTSCLSENPVYAFRTMRAIFAEGLKMFLRPFRCFDRPAAFVIRSNGNTE